MTSTSIACTSTYEIDGVLIFERDCTAEIEYTASRYELWFEVTEFIFEDRNWRKDAETGEHITTSRFATMKPDHPLFALILEGIGQDWLRDKIIEKEEIFLDRESDEWALDYRSAAL